MAGQDELVQLEAERERLLSMIAYHNRPFFRVPPTRAPNWFVVIAIANICGFGVLIVAAVFAGQIDPLVFILLIFLVVALPLLAYISTRKITLFGVTFHVGDVLVVLFSSPEHPVGPAARPGEPQVLQRLAECEARIRKLKEGRP
jgi:hypothetical protein